MLLLSLVLVPMIMFVGVMLPELSVVPVLRRSRLGDVLLSQMLG